MRFRIETRGFGSSMGFDLLDQDSLVLSSGAFPQRDACLEAIRQTIDRLTEPDSLGVRAVEQGWQVVLDAADSTPLAQSPLYTTEAEARALIAGLLETAEEQERYEIEILSTSVTAEWVVTPFQRAGFVEIALLYDFSFQSQSGAAGFETFESPRNGRFYFHFNDGDGIALLFSRGFADASRRNQRLRAVAENGGLEQRYEIVREDDGFRLILKARNGQEIARSRRFTSEDDARTWQSLLQVELARHAEALGERRTRKSGRSDRYRLDLLSRSRVEGFERIRADDDRQYYFLFNDAQGIPLLFSQGYGARGGRDHGLRALIRYGGNAARTELLEEEGRFAFAIRAGNRQELARSRWFASRQELVDCLVWIRMRIPTYAAAFGVRLELLERTEIETLSMAIERGPGQAARPSLRGEDSSDPGQGEEDTEGASEMTVRLEALFTDEPTQGGVRIPSLTLDPDQITSEASSRHPPSLAQRDPATPDAAVVVPASSSIPASEAADLKSDPHRRAETAVASAPAASKGDVGTDAVGGASAGGFPAWLMTLGMLLLVLLVIWLFLREGCGTLGSQGKLPLRSPPGEGSARPDEPTEFGLQVPSGWSTPGFVRFRNTQTGSYHFHFNGNDGTPWLFSRDFEVDDAREQGLAETMRLGAMSSRYVRRSDDTGFFAILTRDGGEVLARTRGEASPETLEAFLQELWQMIAASSGAGAQPGPDGADPSQAGESSDGGNQNGSAPAEASPAASGSGFPVVPMPARAESASAPAPDGGQEPPPVDPHATHLGRSDPAVSTAPLREVERRAGTLEERLLQLLRSGEGDLPLLLSMDRLQYPPNSHEIPVAGKEQIFYLAAVLKAYPTARIEIRGHIDGTEQEKYDGPNPYRDYTLSQLRADCVYRRLLYQGVRREQLRFRSYGATRPVASNGTGDGRQANRRVEIELLSR